ncbi:homocysteine S-methyltransferase family protein, partial [Pelagibacteraceae bacterium]|nr:homocysteine S-methyltransferase family protein [Pelagibacteraceae bacterium]
GFEGHYDYIDPVELLGTRNEEFGEEKYKNFVLHSLTKGVTLVGGCCEIKPRHIEAIKNLF